MSYEVIARKWRPQQFSDVVGQEHVTRTLSNAITSDRIAHAYLFVGPRGVGKTSLARIFAKALNCEKGPGPTPCDACSTCKEIVAGTSLDVLEIDGASNNGVEQVRELRDTVRYAPSSARYKIYIIDEVHMLSAAAFNALLKTLEEPPAHAKFIFATTEPQKILATILSRCQRFDLRRINTALIAARLGEIAKAEGVTIEPAALDAIARGSEGGLRDAQSSLDQLISFQGDKIGEEDVLSVFGLVARKTIEDLAAAVLESDVATIIRVLAELDSNGKDMQRLLIELLEHFRNVLVLHHAGQEALGQDVGPDLLPALQQQSDSTDAERLLRVLEHLGDAEARLRYALSKRTVMETALIKAAHSATVVTIAEILRQLNELKKKVADGNLALPAPPPETSSVTTTGTVTHEPPEETAAATSQSSEYVREEPTRYRPPPIVDEPVPDDVNPSRDLAILAAEWDDIIERAGKIAPPVRVCLKDCKPVAVAADSVTLAVDPEFPEYLDRLTAARSKRALQHVIKESLRRPVSLHVEVGDDASFHEAVQAATAASEEEAEDEEPDYESPAITNAGSIHDWKQDPAVQRALEVFNGTIVEIREKSQ